jgi:3-oxoacyl-[acyl-carrier-protein] synthase II
MRKKPRVVITAYGAVAPQALSAEDFWQKVRAGHSAITRIERFKADSTGTSIGGEVPPFSTNFLHPSGIKAKRIARHTLLLLAATEPIRQELAKLPHLAFKLGIATSCFSMIGDSGAARAESGCESANIHMIPQAPPHAAAGALAQFLDRPCEAETISTACAAGTDAVGRAYQDIQDGRHRCLLAAGTDSALGLTPLAEFVKAGMASLRNSTPAKASRPFDAFCDSGVLAEGAAVLLVEELEHALMRGAIPLCEIVGYGMHLDTDSTRPGSGYAASMKRALEDGGLAPSAIDYVSAWGPGHPVLDRVEAECLREVFADHCNEMPVTSIKGVIGNPLAAAGPLQVIATIRGFQEQIIPPTANHEVRRAGCHIRVPKSALSRNHSSVLLNAHGVGGANSSLILKSCDYTHHARSN